MKITNVSCQMVRWSIPNMNYGGQAVGFGGEKELAVIKIETDEGIEGNAFLGSTMRSGAVDAGPLLEHLKPVVINQNPMDLGRLYKNMWHRNRFASLRAIGAMDIALWDIAGKIAGLPIHRMLGTYKESIPAYASSAFLPDVESYVEEAIKYKSMNWKAYKIHPHAIPDKDIEICRAVRKAVGDDYPLMLDSCWAYGYEDALRVGRAIEELNFVWYEDPFAEDDIYNYAKLHEKLDIPILATEYTPGGVYGLIPFITQKGSDMLRGDVRIKGGITGLYKIGILAEAFRMKCEVHHGGNAMNNVANLHVSMALDNCDFYEVLLPQAAQEFGLTSYVEIDSNGMVHASEKPGLGYEIDWELANSKTVRVIK